MPLPILAAQYTITWTTNQPHKVTISAERLAELLCVEVDDLDPASSLTQGPEISLVDALAEIEASAITATGDLRRDDVLVSPVHYRPHTAQPNGEHTS